MGKTFTDLMEIHRTFSLPGYKGIGSDAEREAQALRLDKGHGPGRVPKASNKRYRAFEFPCGQLGGQKLCSPTPSPVVISNSWMYQDFDRFATPWETKRSVLCADRQMAFSSEILAGTPGDYWFAPVIRRTGGFDALVVGHVGVVASNFLIIPEAVKRLVSSEHSALYYGVPMYVADESGDSGTVPPGWKKIGHMHRIWTVHAAPDGRVLRLTDGKMTGGIQSANWVIDLVVALATLALARSGLRLGMSLAMDMPVGGAPRVLTGATRAAAEAEAGAAKLAAARAQCPP